jgi:hypothetical protein
MKVPDPSGKTLLEPKLIPPVDGDQITKPLMSHLMHIDNTLLIRSNQALNSNVNIGLYLRPE